MIPTASRRPSFGQLATRAVFIAVLLIVVACTPRLSPTQLSTIKTIGVVLLVGDDITVKRGSLTALLDDDGKSFSRPDWGIKRRTFELIKENIGGQFDVQEATYPRGIFETGKPLKDVVLSDVQPHGLDAYLVVTPASYAANGTNAAIKGTGLIRNSTPFDYYVFAYANYALDLYDGKDFRHLASGLAPSAKQINKTLWADSLDKMSGTQQDSLRAAFSQLPTSASISGALKFMHLQH